MKKTLTRSLALLVALMLAMPGAVLAQDSTVQTATAEQAATLLSYGVASVQYAMMKDGQVILSDTAGAFSLSDPETPLTSETPYGVGSVSKIFTTAVVMKLVDEGLIELDTPVKTYVPEFEMADARYADITVRHLLNHASGLPGTTAPAGVLWEGYNDGFNDGFLAALKTMRLKADPGAYSVYCNDGFTLAEIVCQRVTGSSLSQLIAQLTELPGTFTPDLEGSEHTYDELARTYRTDGSETPAETLSIIGAGGVYSTAEDLLRMAQLFTGESDVLSPEAQAATMEPEYRSGQWMEEGDSIFGFGLGWDSVETFPFNRYGIKALWKGGDTSQYHAAMVVLPEHNMSAAVLTSGGDSISNLVLTTNMLLAQLLEDGVIEELLPPVAMEAQPVALDIEVEGYAGPYAMTTMAYSISFDEAGAMSLSVPMLGEGASQQFNYVGEGRWQDSATGSQAWFEYNEVLDATYLAMRQYVTLPGLGQTAIGLLTAQKLPADPDSESGYYTPDQATLAAWQARHGMLYFLVSEPWNSSLYGTLQAMNTGVDEANPGYMNTYRLADENTLAAWVQIPVNMGRDCDDIVIWSRDGLEYARYVGCDFVSMAALAPLWEGQRSICTIQPGGDARWYSFGQGLAGKTVTVELPEESAFAVYDMNGQLVCHGPFTGNTFQAPEGGFIVFIGSEGAVFEINAQ